MIKFDEHIGEEIALCPKNPLSSSDQPGKLYFVKLIGVDVGGIWFEHQQATDEMVEEWRSQGLVIHPSFLQKVLAFFVPYSEIYFAFLLSTKVDESLGV